MSAARKRNAASDPPASAIGGSASAPIRPPSGIAVCRTPSAKPRSSAPNQCMTARPLAELTALPAAPTRTRKTTSSSKLDAYAAPTRQAALATIPTVSASRSPKRSAASPHGRSVSVVPTHDAASSTPIWPSERSYSSRSCGTITGRPIPKAALLVAAAVPAARTAHR